MGIFGNLFSEDKYPEQTKANREEFERKLTEQKQQAQDMSKDAVYMVGMNEDGMTQLKVGYPTSVTLTLNADGVALLIKQLAVSIDEDYTVKVTRVEYKDE